MTTSNEPDWVKKFNEVHGNYVISSDGRLKIYEDGSWRTNVADWNASMEHAAEKMDELTRRKYIVLYHEERLEQAVRAFDQLQESMLNNPDPQREDEHLARLKAQQANVKAIQRDLEKAIVERNAVDPSYRTPEELREQAERQRKLEEEQAAFRNKVRNIKI